ncbi:hypothetical protein DFP72DRAFT_224873 [Ephemerocybe angulata]|uniref:Uncharacterized protein n=1 Tax=Ephemerocybe angulata TaxID=980116 RepID=A0A8H6MA94_9AGAR|nr:hypothetical protein DFP72DRAFT_224873 [Tulosesus angulatus]
MLLTPYRARSTISWILPLVVLLSFQACCIQVAAVAHADVIARPNHHAQHHDIPQHDHLHEPPHEYDEELHSRSPYPNPAPPPIRPPGPPDTHPSPVKGSEGNDTSSHLVCKPFGECEPCPPESLGEPFCQPFGNRRLMHCVTNTTSPSSIPPTGSSGSSSSPYDDEHSPHERSSSHSRAQASKPKPVSKEEGRTLAWESCGRIPRQEKADFFEFVACNVAFVIISLAVVIWRSRVVKARQQRVLAARIGVGGRRRA